MSVKSAAKEHSVPAVVQESVGGLAVVSQEEFDIIGNDLGAGLENISMRDQVVPYIKVIQQLSPELNPRKPEYIEGVEIGDFVNSATGRVQKELRLIAVAYRWRNVEWKPLRGGFVKDWGDDDAILKASKRDEKTGELITPDGNVIQSQGTWFCLDVSNDIPERIVVSLSKTQLKRSKEWMSKINGEKVPVKIASGIVLATPPIWYRSYKAVTQPESNDRGDWMGWKITPAEKTLDLPGVGRMFYDLAKNFALAVQSGEVQAAVEEAPAERGSSEEAPF